MQQSSGLQGFRSRTYMILKVVERNTQIVKTMDPCAFETSQQGLFQDLTYPTFSQPQLLWGFSLPTTTQYVKRKILGVPII